MTVLVIGGHTRSVGKTSVVGGKVSCIFSPRPRRLGGELPYPAYIAITRSIARRHTAQNVLCRVNMMQSSSGR